MNPGISLTHRLGPKNEDSYVPVETPEGRTPKNGDPRTDPTFEGPEQGGPIRLSRPGLPYSRVHGTEKVEEGGGRGRMIIRGNTSTTSVAVTCLLSV